MENTNFEIIARAVIISENKILLCKRKDRSYYFLPGGHVEFGEKAEDALTREIKEELSVETRYMEFIGASENIFRQDEKLRHEYNLVFFTKLVSITARSAEEHLVFTFIEKSEFANVNLLPQSLVKTIIKWLADQKPFWISQDYQS